MTTTPSPGAVVVGIDDSDGGRRALDTAVSEALLSHRPLHVVHTWASYPTGYTAGTYPHTATELADSIREYAASVLATAVARVREEHPTLQVTDELAAGDARQVLEDLSRDAALLVVGSRGHGALKRMLLGSTSAWLARHAHSPLLVVRPSLDGEKRRVAVGTDGGHASTAGPRLRLRGGVAARRAADGGLLLRPDPVARQRRHAPTSRPASRRRYAARWPRRSRDWPRSTPTSRSPSTACRSRPWTTSSSSPTTSGSSSWARTAARRWGA